MRRQATPGFAYEPKAIVVEEKKKYFPRQMPGRKKPAAAGRGRNQYSGFFASTSKRSRTARP
jgi:hypothetical protein